MLLRDLETSRDTLSDTLRSLTGNGIVLRPEKVRGMYSLTEAGHVVGEACGPVVAAVQKHGVVEVALKKWPMLVLTACGLGAGRYFEMKAALPGITPRALAQALKDLEGAGLILRTTKEGHPSASSYTLTEKAQAMFPPLAALVVACERAVAVANLTDGRTS